MSSTTHHLIVVTSTLPTRLDEAEEAARALFFPGQIARVVPSINRVETLIVGPDGSKDGWEESAQADLQRAAFVMWLDEHRSRVARGGLGYFEWFEVCYGDRGDRTGTEDGVHLVQHYADANRRDPENT